MVQGHRRKLASADTPDALTIGMGDMPLGALMQAPRAVRARYRRAARVPLADIARHSGLGRAKDRGPWRRIDRPHASALGRLQAGDVAFGLAGCD